MLILQKSHDHSTNFVPWFAKAAQDSLWFQMSENPSASSTSSSESTDSGSNFFPSKTSLYPSQSELRRFDNKDEKSNYKSELDVPSDPRLWLREDVQNWLVHMSDVHGIPKIDNNRFLMNGKALCLMTIDMFCQRVPLGGKMLFKDFQLRLSMAMYSNNNNR